MVDLSKIHSPPIWVDIGRSLRKETARGLSRFIWALRWPTLILLGIPLGLLFIDDSLTAGYYRLIGLLLEAALDTFLMIVEAVFWVVDCFR